MGSFPSPSAASGQSARSLLVLLDVVVLDGSRRVAAGAFAAVPPFVAFLAALSTPGLRAANLDCV